MKLEIRSISFSNIMSFGTSPTTIEFKNGLTLWSGANGQGKSSALLDTLSYCLYGKPYRKIKLDELINRKNKQGLKTKCVFAIDDDIYTLTRTKSPDKLELLKNDVAVDLLSSKKLTQGELDKLLGISYEIFKQTISIAVSYNKPFLVLDSKEKRKTIEQMFGISEFAKMNKVLSEKNKTAKRNHDILENNIENIKSTISLLNKQVIDLEEQNRNFDRITQENIQKHLKQIETEQPLLLEKTIESESIEDQIQKLKEKIKSLCKEKYVSAQIKLQKQSNDQSWNVNSYTKQIQKLKTETVCPICKTPFPEDKRLVEIADKEKLKLDSETIIKDVTIKLETLAHNIELIEEKESKVVQLEYQLRDIKNEIRIKQTSIKNHENQIVELKSAKNEIDVDKIKKQIIQKETELSSNIERKNTEATNIKNYAVVDKVLSDEGARSYIIDKIIPIINTKINEYLTMFEIPVKVVFDKYMEEKIFSLEHFKQEISYFSFSEGEKKRLDFSIMLALVETMKIVSNWFADVFIIDELLDNAVDLEGLEKMIVTLKDISDKKKIGIYIISHRMNDNFAHLFNNRMVVKKNASGFSVIEQDK